MVTMRIPIMLFLLLGATAADLDAQQRTSPWAPLPIAPSVWAATPQRAVGAPRPLATQGGSAPVAVAQSRQHTLVGAGVGLLVGAAATYAVLYSGGSTSLCNRSANQDAMNVRECTALLAAGGVLGAGIGAIVGRRLGRR
jgi:hypothetical protein